MTEQGAPIKYTGDSKEAGSACYRCQERKAFPGNSPVKVRVAVFFDGTLNNRTNTWLGEKGIIRGTSYENALTNVAIMELYFRKNDEYHHSFSIYIEGIATTDEESDSTIVAATGRGKTGILGKVERGISKIVTEINKKVISGGRIECLHLDCLGFSRGAAAARNFIYSALIKSENTLKLRLQSSGRSVDDINIKFVGLYDTVASFGMNSFNDTDELHLDAIRHAEYVVQLAAAEEHRKHFPLTNINSAPKGVQLFLPGSHSDIGGGYLDKMDEVDHQILFVYRRNGLGHAEKAALAREREWLLASGWYYEDEIQAIDQWDEVKATRRSISNEFHRIPLKMMAEFAIEKGLNISPSMMEDYTISPYLQEVYTLICESPLSSSEHWLNLKTHMMKRLRHDYLHFSACFGSVMGCNEPQFVENKAITGHRKREVLNG